MTCFNMMKANRLDNGAIVFHSALKGWNPSQKWKPTDVGEQLLLPCGQCIGCRIEKSRTWAMRCIHEAQLHTENCFITLTYSPENLPPDAGLIHLDYQKFMRALRYRYPDKKIKYYMCGEYGDRSNRPHYHAILFGINFDDWEFVFNSPSGEPVYTSKTLEKIWGLGFVTVGTVTFESAGYVARYCLKKITGKGKEQINEKTGLKPYERVNSFTGEIVEVLPEYATMSRGGRTGRGIAFDWFTKYKSDVYPKDYTSIRGMRMRPTRYYDKCLHDVDPDMYDDIKAGRAYLSAISLDNSESRLRQKKTCIEAKTKLLERMI